MDNQPDKNSHNQQNNQRTNPDNQGDPQAQLRKLKSKAVDALLPVVEKIDGPVERRFEVLMTAARSSGDPSLLGRALDAAQQIGDGSQKADAILDVLNEINYQLREA